MKHTKGKLISAGEGMAIKLNEKRILNQTSIQETFGKVLDDFIKDIKVKDALNTELLEALKMVKEIWDKEEFNNWMTPIVYSKVKQAIKKAEC